MKKYKTDQRCDKEGTVPCVIAESNSERMTFCRFSAIEFDVMLTCIRLYQCFLLFFSELTSASSPLTVSADAKILRIGRTILLSGAATR